jgi:hypothetical protein
MQAEGVSDQRTLKSAVVFHREAEKQPTENVGIRSIMMLREMSTIMTMSTMKTIVHLLSIVIMRKRMKSMTMTSMMRMRTKRITTSLILDTKTMMRRSIPTEEGLYRDVVPEEGIRTSRMVGMNPIPMEEMIPVPMEEVTPAEMRTMVLMTPTLITGGVLLTDGAIPIPMKEGLVRVAVLSRAAIPVKVVIPIRIVVQDRVATPVMAGASPLWIAMT